MNVFNHITREERAKEGKVRRNRIEGQQIGAVTKLQKTQEQFPHLFSYYYYHYKTYQCFNPSDIHKKQSDRLVLQCGCNFCNVC